MSCQKNWMSQHHSGSDNPQWIDGESRRRYYGENWLEQREQALERDDYQCTECGIERYEHIEQYDLDLHVHHKTPLRTFDEPKDANYLENLQTVCIACHKHVE